MSKTLDEPLICDVMLPPATIIKRGCDLRTLLVAINQRGKLPPAQRVFRDAALAQQPATVAVPSDCALRSRVADLLHLLQFAKIETPSHGDAAQAEVAMNDLERMLTAPAAPVGHFMKMSEYGPWVEVRPGVEQDAIPLYAAPAAPAAQEPVAQDADRIAGYRVDEKLLTTWAEAQALVRTGRTRNGTIEPLYTAPPAAEQPAGTTSDKYRAELYDEVWEMARSMGHGNVTEALVELERMKTAKQPDTVKVPRELLEELADIADAMQCYDARDGAVALLGKEGEA